MKVRKILDTIISNGLEFFFNSQNIAGGEIMKSKLLSSILLIFGFIIFPASSGFAACANVVGTWKTTTMKIAYYNPSNETYGFVTDTKTLHITKQQGCVFYGYDESNDGFTGSIRGTKVTITATHNLSNGNLSNLDSVSEKYKSMTVDGNMWPQVDGDVVANYNGTLTRQ